MNTWIDQRQAARSRGVACPQPQCYCTISVTASQSHYGMAHRGTPSSPQHGQFIMASSVHNKSCQINKRFKTYARQWDSRSHWQSVPWNTAVGSAKLSQNRNFEKIHHVIITGDVIFTCNLTSTAVVITGCQCSLILYQSQQHLSLHRLNYGLTTIIAKMTASVWASLDCLETWPIFMPFTCWLWR